MPRRLIRGTSKQQSLRTQIIGRMRKQIANAEAIIAIVENPDVSSVGSAYTRLSLMGHHKDVTKEQMDEAFTITESC